MTDPLTSQETWAFLAMWARDLEATLWGDESCPDLSRDDEADRSEALGPLDGQT